MRAFDKALVKAFQRRAQGVAQPATEFPDCGIPMDGDVPVDIQNRSETWRWPSLCAALLGQTRNGFVRLSAELTDLASQGIAAIGFSGSERGSGRTSVLLTLAQVLTTIDDPPFLLIDLDFGHPDLAPSLGLSPARGLCEVLRSESTLNDAILQRPGTNLHVLPLVEQCEFRNVSPLLGQQFMRVMRDIRGEFGLILVDLGPVAQVSQVSPNGFRGGLDGVVTVSSKRSPSNPGLLDAQYDYWRQHGVKPLGVIETFS